MEVCAVVLAAGEGRRMKSRKAKVVHLAAGKPLIGWVREALDQAGARDQVYVVGYAQDQVRQVLGEDVAFVIQEHQLGTGHAVLQAAPFLHARDGATLVVSGDAPLVTGATLRQALDLFERDQLAVLMLSAETDDPTGYGRVLRDADGQVRGVVEERNATDGERRIREVKSSLYCFRTPLLLSALGRLGSGNAHGEIHLSDAVSLLITDGHRAGAFRVPFEEILSVNDRVQLQVAGHLLNRRICLDHMRNGVTILDPDSTWIEAGVDIGPDTEILPGCHLSGQTTVGEDCRIGPNTRLVDMTIGSGVTLDNTVAVRSRIGDQTTVGPFAYVRPGSVIGAHCRIGDFVEVKNAVIGAHSTAAHLAYIGDADVGENVNYGCGCITVNYDGLRKHRTTIGDNAFVGSNSNLVAPVTVEDNAYVAAGSTITDTVPAYAMAIARERQVVKENWVVTRNRIRRPKSP